MLSFGDVVPVDFPGAQGLKRRPAVVVSSNTYHTEHADVIVGVLTTKLAAARTASDYVLQDWHQAGLRLPSAFRWQFWIVCVSVWDGEPKVAKKSCYAYYVNTARS